MIRRPPYTPYTALGLVLASLGTQASPQDGFRLEVDAPREALSGVVIDGSVRLTVPGEVRSWSVSYVAEGLQVMEASAAGTDFDRFDRGGFAESGIALEGGGFYSIGVLSFEEPASLPAGTWEVLRTKALVTLKDEGVARWTPADPMPGDSRQIRNEALIPGGEVVPVAASGSSIEVTGCAEVLLVPRGGPEPLEVRRDTAILVDVVVRVPAGRYLNPSGLALELVHDTAALRLDGAEPSPEATALAAPDGVASAETSAEGLSANLRGAEGRRLGPGDHVVFTISYAFQAKVRGGSHVFTRVGPPDEGVRGGAVLEPGGAPPCAPPERILELIVAPDGWVRGDVTADGLVDISDAISALRALFQGGEVLCVRAMETNSDGHVDIADSIYLLAHLFSGGTPLAHPFPECGAAEEDLPCEVFLCPAT